MVQLVRGERCRYDQSSLVHEPVAPGQARWWGSFDEVIPAYRLYACNGFSASSQEGWGSAVSRREPPLLQQFAARRRPYPYQPYLICTQRQCQI